MALAPKEAIDVNEELAFHKKRAETSQALVKEAKAKLAELKKLGDKAPFDEIVVARRDIEMAEKAFKDSSETYVAIDGKIKRIRDARKNGTSSFIIYRGHRPRKSESVTNKLDGIRSAVVWDQRVDGELIVLENRAHVLEYFLRRIPGVTVSSEGAGGGDEYKLFNVFGSEEDQPKVNNFRRRKQRKKLKQDRYLDQLQLA